MLAITGIVLFAVMAYMFYSPRPEVETSAQVRKVKIFEPVEERCYQPIDLACTTFNSPIAEDVNVNYEASEISSSEELDITSIFGEGTDIFVDEEMPVESLKGTSFYEPIERGIVQWEAQVLEINKDFVYLYIIPYQCKRWYVIDNLDHINVGEILNITLDLDVSEELITDYKKIHLN
ncbi:hypothetical protein LAV72_18180 [Lysinibacillus xylanilyticus]|uniref:hypothetical protein n=1 Tax=Lysinibacillus xylanilyticus TaxID=582475 RepID=UPI002B2483FD|nr:hypothetical protein [Lysinibacillus xylanilyticus]MEB2301536.1 hypothetical protein [Lysinibacillus xylanilyticus]